MNTKYKKLAKYIVYMKLIKSLGEIVEHAREIQYLCERLIIWYLQLLFSQK